MFSEDNKTGILLHEKDIKLYRQYFIEMCNFIGIKVIYRAPKKDKRWSQYSEIEANYQEPEIVSCIFDEHPTQWTMKKLGWNTELNDSVSLISVPYNLHDLQAGALFIVPSGIDNSKGRLFRVSRLKVGAIYPASVTCELVPEYIDTFSNDLKVHSTDDFSLLSEEEDCNQ